MLSLLVKIFVKNPTDYNNSKVRSDYGILCGGFGIFWNIILFISKIIGGTIISSVSMVADAINNLSDAASSLVQIFGFKLAQKKPDPEHPFGHGRFEYIAGLIISFLILLMGVELLKSSVDALIHPQSLNFSIVSMIIMGVAILIKFYMYIYNHNIAKKINSVSMEATAKDSLSDTISTFVVIISVVASRFTTFPVDGIGGIIVACFILKTGIESAKDTIEPLLGMAPSQDFVDAIEKEVLSHKPIIGIHDLVVHDYGPGRVMISLHAEVPGNMDVFELHDVIDVTEVSVSQKLNCHCVIHMDPINNENPRLMELKSIIREELANINPAITFHDVRMVPGVSHTNLIFDVVKPFNCEYTDEQLKKMIFEAINKRCNDVSCVVTVDVPFVK